MEVSLRFDIYERIVFPDSYSDIFEMIEARLTPSIKTTLVDDFVELKGNLILFVHYKSNRGSSSKNEHRIPIDISIPANRVMNIKDIETVIERFKVEVLSPKEMNVSGILVVAERVNEMEKVKLPKEVAEELESIKVHESYPVRLVVDIFSGDYTESGALKEYFESDRSRRIGYIMTALVNGYEIEETPEDKVREYAELLRVQHINATVGRNDTSSPYGDELRGCMKTLDKLGIQLEGVNT